MRTLTQFCLFVFIFIQALTPVSAQERTDQVDPFEIRGISGEMISIKPTPERRLVVICFLGTECPLAKLYAARLNQFSRKYSASDVMFVGIASNRQDSEEELIAFGKSAALEFPLAKDHRNVIADQLNATRTPEVVVLDQEMKIVYRGRIDDQYLPGTAKARPSKTELKTAIEQWLMDEAISTPVTQVEGCIIGRVKQVDSSSPVTFSNQVSRILQKHCVECHRDGDIGPFSLTDYDEVVGWGEMLNEVIAEGRMPPWHASPDHGEFSNARHMPESDKQMLRDWVAAGSPFGKQEELPELKERISGWRLPREPDQVVDMRAKPFLVPAEGTVEYQYFVVDPGFEEDKWVVAAEVVPGNRSVVHHSIVFVRPPDGVPFEGLGWLGAYVPGQRETTYPKGFGRRIPAGSKLVFQQHYTPVGSEQSDVTKIGLVFGQESGIDHKVFTLVAIDQQFEIPPRSEHTVEAKVRNLPDQGKLLSVAPHMHYRGKSCRVNSSSAKNETIILDVPNYDFNWQHSYLLKEPLDLAEVDEISIHVTFDNSDSNPANPDSSQTVFWGDQTWEEMAVAFFEIAKPIDQDGLYHGQPVDYEFTENEKRAQQQFATDFFERFDANRDGKVVRSELPHSMRGHLINWDANRNGSLQPDDIALMVEWDFRRMEETESRRAAADENKND